MKKIDLQSKMEPKAMDTYTVVFEEEFEGIVLLYYASDEDQYNVHEEYLGGALVKYMDILANTDKRIIGTTIIDDDK